MRARDGLHRPHAICGREALCLRSQDSSGGQTQSRSNGIAYFVSAYTAALQVRGRRAGSTRGPLFLITFFLVA